MKFYMYGAEDPFFVFGYGNRQDTLLRIRVGTTRNLGVHFFPDRENTGNLSKTIENMLLYREFTFQH